MIMKKNNDNVLADIDDVLKPSTNKHYKFHYNPFEEDPANGLRTPGHHKHKSPSSSIASSPSSSSPNGYSRNTFSSPPSSPSGMMKALPTITEPIDNIRQKIKEAVHTALWTVKMQDEYTDFMTKLKESIKKSPDKIPPRCIVCTLPYGTCVHTEEWLKEEHPEFVLPSGVFEDTVKKSAIESEIDDVLGLIEHAELKVDTKPLDNDIDIDSSRWVIHEPRRSDKIGDTYISLFTPSPRGWHTTVEMLDDRLVVVFGGFRFKKTEIPQPFGGATMYEDVEYLSDLLVYDRENASWHAMKGNGKGVGLDARSDAINPPARYGHVATALDDRRMLIFGGRGVGGKLLKDTWIYDCQTDSWSNIPFDPLRPGPTARIFASMAADAQVAFMFGGTDGMDNYGDVWIFKAKKHEMFWERAVIVGSCPSPRYGHRLVFIEPGKMAVLGGCSVSPQSEVAGSALTLAETKNLLNISEELQSSYRGEGFVAHASSLAYDASISEGEKGLRSLYKGAGSISNSIYTVEVNTRAKEKELVDTWYVAQASKITKRQKAKHPDANLDVIFLNTRDLTWKAQVYPPIKGDIPSCRMHFGSFSIGHYIFLCGGTAPTCKHHKPVEEEFSRLYALDLLTMKWFQPHPVNSAEMYEIPLQIAESDVIRSSHKVKDEKLRALSLNARNGMTVELAEAEAVLNVCKWRFKTLEKEKENSQSSPLARWGATFTKFGQRAFYLGGWGHNAIIGKNGIFELDLEHELEKRRREIEDFRAKLERDKTMQDGLENMSNMQSAYELRALIMAEKMNEAREKRQMAFEEILSTVPPLSIPAPIRFVKANSNTIWVEWDRVKKNADNYPVNPDSITYYLYVRNGYRHLRKEDRVLVTPKATKFVIPQHRDDDSTQPGGDDNDSMDDEFTKESNADKEPEVPVCAYRTGGYSGEIIRCHRDGKFDVAYDDGSMEKKVNRSRISLENPFGNFTGCYFDQNGTHISMKNSDYIREGMAIIVKNRIRKKLRRKQKTLEKLQALNPDFVSVKEQLEVKRQNNHKVDKKSKIKDSESNEDKSSDEESENEDLRASDEIMDDLQRIKHGGLSSFRDALEGEVTVKPSAEWELLYVGNDNSYACVGLVPDDIIENEPNIMVAAEFFLQTHGADFPPYERSNLSPAVVFNTEKPGSLLPENFSMTSYSDMKPTQKISKLKKEVISAMINDKHLVQIEKQNNSVTSEGINSDFI